MYYSFNGKIAELYGTDEAVIIQNIYWWIEKNEANGKHFYDGRTWTYNSAEAFAKLFPFISVHRIRRILNKLEQSGVIMTGNYNKSGFDRTKWYALSDEVLNIYSQNCEPHFTNLQTPFRKSAKPIPDINTDIYKHTISPTLSGESVSIEDVFDKTYAIYPRKEGKTKGRQAYVSYLKKGRNVGGKRVRLNHQQIYFAVQAYAANVEGKDKQYIQHFDTFMNSTVLDYVDQTKQDYEAWMAERYGEDWQNIKFDYRG